MTARGDCDFAMVVLKGIVEHNDRGVYFGSFFALDEYTRRAQVRGWLDDQRAVTAAGAAAYEAHGLATLPRAGRAYMWRWDSVPAYEVAK